MSVTPGEVILEVKDLRTHFFTRTSVVKAVDGVSFNLRQGETLGIVGESGCGKTMTALSLLRLVPKPAGRIVSGEILLNGEDLVQMSDEEMRQVRGKRISMILQDPQTSLVHGYVAWKLGDTEQAYRSLERTLALDADNVLAHCLMGEILVTRQETRRARHYWRRALQIDPESRWARRGLDALELASSG